MKKFIISFTAVFLLESASIACEHHEKQSKHKDLNEVLQKAGKELDLDQVLNDLKMVPLPNSASEEKLWKIESVQKGSVFSKAGIKAGDIVSMKTADASVTVKVTVEEESELE
ncbi:MAG: hypothetical protein ACK5WZ_05990 [Pseudobdellovibrionaceae bacterium]